jgi:hypothetical protein
MNIELDRDTISDELYNKLLQHFVNKAVAQGVFVTKHTKFEDWVLTCRVENTVH